MPGSDNRRTKRTGDPPDQAQRELIVSELDRSTLVEAAAGTGKTTSMVDRMVALLAEGKCRADTLAAVTFTRKAAAELRSRFALALEVAARDAGGARRPRLERALDDSARAFIGTIHSFCARLLRERPVEAGVDVSFQEIDEQADARLRELAWAEFVAGLHAADDTLVAELAELGLDAGALARPFMRFADYPDVDEWPAEAGEAVGPAPAREALLEYARHMRELVPTLPDDAGNDRLIPKYKLIARIVGYADLDTPAGLAEVLGQFGKAGIVQKEWPEGKEQAKAEQLKWNEFAERFARPLVEDVLARRYTVAIRALENARKTYDRLREDLGLLNYQDLLMKAAGLLRDRPHVRRYFRERFTHLLVDEFQDTDPVQAEVMMLLASDDPGERDWRKCRPAGGSLFVVGDPKQSIYRFRRADIVTYSTVKEIIRRSGGALVELSANFRTTAPVIDWVNGAFGNEFPETPTEFSPSYVPLRCARSDEGEGELSGVRVLPIDEEHATKDAVAAYEPPLIARTIRKAVDSGASPADFMIVTRQKHRLGRFARALEELGIPHQVTGGNALGDVRELDLLCRALRAASEPENPVALVAALRSELFGISDAALYAFRRAEGEFSFRSEVPADMASARDREVFVDAFARLARYARWLQTIPPAAAVERVVADLGLAASAAASLSGPTGGGGAERAGSLAKAVELLRAEQSAMQSETWSVSGAVDYLESLARGDEKHDGASARASEESAVRVMNLHKVKGLEAPVVFLADPIGEFEHPVQVHIDRSGDAVRGYLALHGERRGNAPPPLLARPRDWEEFEAKEKCFGRAEATRLLYVAATRAGSGLVVTQRAKGNHLNPWKFFAPRLEGLPELADPGPQEAPAASRVKVAEDEPARATEAIRARWEAAREPSYSLLRAKEDAVEAAALLGVTNGDAATGEAARAGSPPAKEDPSPGPASGEHGTEWGEVIHALLEAAMANPEADLRALAQAELAEHGLGPSLADEAVETVKGAAASDIWRRARESPRRLVEVPFQLAIKGDGEHRAIVRGVIDLAFREDGGWVIVDYKTDRAAAASLGRLVERYRPQLAAYAATWRKCVGEPVRETGILFVRTGSYRVVTRAESG